MNLSVGWTYKFIFKTGFTLLNGVYTVLKIYAYSELINEGIDLNSGLYSFVNKTPAELEADVNTYRKGELYKIVSPEDSTKVYYIPESICETIPDPNIKKYSNLVIGINVGVYESPDELTHVIDNVSQILEKSIGCTEDPKLFTIGYKWLTDTEFQSIKDDRSTLMTETINYYSKIQELLALIAKQQDYITVLETHIQNS